MEVNTNNTFTKNDISKEESTTNTFSVGTQGVEIVWSFE
jgi:hypothetical protein